MSLIADDPGSRTTAVRVVELGEQHRGALQRLVAQAPIVNAVVDARLRTARRLTTRELGGAVLGAFDDDGVLGGAVLDAGSVQPVGGAREHWDALARYLAGHPRGCSSIVGPREAVEHIWSVLQSHWGPARAVRERQPLLTVSRGCLVPPGEPALRPMRMADLDAYLPAAAAMFTEELGVSPVRGTAGVREYRSRLAGLIAARRAYGIRGDDGRVVFKADFGCVTPDTVQVQGVWTHPSLRGRGIAGRAMASVLQAGLELAPTVSLYVNDFNTPAVRLYRRLGMTRHAELSTVLF